MARRRYLEGLENVQRVFRDLPRVSQEKITVALNKGAQEIKADAELLVPVGRYRGGGDLKRSIDIEARSAKAREDGKGVVADVIAGTSRGTANAAFRQEFGRAPGPNGHPGHASHSFMFPAYFANRKRVRNRVARAIRDAVKAIRSGR